MAQLLSITLAEGHSSISSTFVRLLTTVCNKLQKGLTHLCFPEHFTHLYIHMQTHTIKKKSTYF